MDANQNATERIKAERNKIKENTEWINKYQKELKDPRSSLNIDASVSNDDSVIKQRGLDYQQKLAEIRTAKNNIYYIIKTNTEDVRYMAASDRKMQSSMKALEDFNPDMNNFEIGSTLDDIKADTGNISNSVDIAEENLQYLRDLADREVINRFTTAEIKVDMQNFNTITGENDLDGIVTSLGVKLHEEMAAAGSYNFIIFR